jgi:hypothetical protein
MNNKRKMKKKKRNLSECWRQDSDPSSFPFTVLHWKKKSQKSSSPWLCLALSGMGLVVLQSK